MAKRRACRAAGRPDILAPTRERQQHGKVERLEKPIADGAGAIARPYRALDTLAVMERRGTITAGMRLAGEEFRWQFTAAHLDPLHAADLQRTTRGHYGSGPTGGMVAAREAVWRAICAVGGLASVDGSCLWHVVGFERSLKEWALEQSWAGRRLSEGRARAVLAAALAVLEVHFGFRGE